MLCNKSASRTEYPLPTDHAPSSLGRNGEVKTTGLEILETNLELTLIPLTSYGEPSRACSIGLAKDPGTLRRFAAEIFDWAAAIEQEARHE